MNNKMKHLEMIQDVIKRMASNSFMLKGWAVTLVAGIFALSSKDSNLLFSLISYIPIIIFWGLDSYYLMQERRFRALYDFIRKQENTNFNMMLPSELLTQKMKWQNCFFSITEVLFYLPLALLVYLTVSYTHLRAHET